mmetsp:Transcript_10187/g.37725  ORF Transcript_10187/g.37725 Transcript_10187/m.37725 type:complete len:315 (+) Transcript_10187:714-1658(+)
MRSRLSVLPLCAGMCRHAHTFGRDAITSSTESGKSFGCGDVNLTRISGSMAATRSRSWANCTLPSLRFFGAYRDEKPSAYPTKGVPPAEATSGDMPTGIVFNTLSAPPTLKSSSSRTFPSSPPLLNMVKKSVASPPEPFSSLYAYELTFCPNRVISLTPCSDSNRTSYSIDEGSLDRSRPRVYGTMQNEHALSHPRMIVTNAACAPSLRTGIISAYVSSTLSCTFIAWFPPLTMLIRFGKSRYASGPATRSASWSVSKSLVFNRSAMHPSTPTTGFSPFFLRRLSDLKYASRCQILASAFSRIAHVFTRITSAS